MITILIVDDNPGDRELARAYLEEIDDVEIRSAAHGLEALEMIKADPPQLVLTDLKMPHMDGLELVAKVHEDFPTIPVILMTSCGSEEIAVTALKRGAASYVSKNSMDQNLAVTASDVLHVAEQGIRRDQLMGSLRRKVLRFEIGNDPEMIPSVVAYLVDSLKNSLRSESGDLTRVGVALQEAIDNAIYHGNLELTSDLREVDASVYYQTASERRKQTPYEARRVHIKSVEDLNQVTFTIRDEGPGFDPNDVPDPTTPENMDRVSGRGLLLIRTFMDEVSHNDVGNEITLVRYHDEASDDADAE